jgi:hypothetical protein
MSFFSSLKLQTGSRVHPASCSVGTAGASFGGYVAGGMKLITHPHLVPELGMSEAIPLLPHMPSWHAHGRTFTLPVVFSN